MIKISVIVVDVLVLAYYLVVFVIPKYDPMYLPADEHRQKNSINSQYDEEGVRGLSKAVQGIKGTYFVYKSRVMFMGDADEKISEVCKMPSDIVGILEKDDTVFLRKYDDVEGIYRAYEEGEAQRLIDDPGTLYMEGDNIYTLSKKNGLRKYDFNEEKKSENNK